MTRRESVKGDVSGKRRIVGVGASRAGRDGKTFREVAMTPPGQGRTAQRERLVVLDVLREDAEALLELVHHVRLDLDSNVKAEDIHGAPGVRRARRYHECEKVSERENGTQNAKSSKNTRQFEPGVARERTVRGASG